MIIRSERVPTEYDISRVRRFGVLEYELSDDRGRKFYGVTIRSAFRKAERAQDINDPIHHPPFPSPHEVLTRRGDVREGES